MNFCQDFLKAYTHPTQIAILKGLIQQAGLEMPLELERFMTDALIFREQLNGVYTTESRRKGSDNLTDHINHALRNLTLMRYIIGASEGQFSSSKIISRTNAELVFRSDNFYFKQKLVGNMAEEIVRNLNSEDDECRVLGKNMALQYFMRLVTPRLEKVYWKRKGVEA